jgi:hypothetical protein
MLMVHSMSSKEWQAGRNRFNHDWLKNKFLLSLDRLVKIAEDTIEDDEYASRFVSGGLLNWAREEATARELIESFEAVMSPRVYLDREPLCRSTPREWLREVVHALWRSRVGVSKLLATAHEKLNAASEAYGELCRCVEGHSGKMDCARLACCRTELVAFRNRCRELATAFEKFPHRVSAT